MKIISNKSVLIEFTHNEKNLGLVPTMGALHQGHISLIKKSITQCEKTIVTIFINKAQFNKKSDFLRYPRVLKKDISILSKFKVDFLFLPTTKQIYPYGENKNIKIIPFGKKLCGKFRPGHFEAIVDVIDRFIKIIKPKKIYFGKKDMQQLKILEHFINKFHPKTKVIACKTIRDKSGVALSSRNILLSVKEKQIAAKIYRLIINNKQNLIKKNLDLRTIKRKIFELGARRIDYIQALDVNKIIKPYKKKINYKIFIAYYIGLTRLIDNI